MPNLVWIWSTGDATLQLSNVKGFARECFLEIELESLNVTRKVSLRERGKVLAEQTLPPGVPTRLSAYLDAIDGERKLELITDIQGAVPGNGDTRMLAFRMNMRTPPLCR